MNNPLVSVVIPLFNKETFISTTLQSVVAQTYPPIELIVVDDSSTDGSFALVKSILNLHRDRFANIQIMSRPNTGQAGARNDGIASASGEFIAFLDADDVWHPDKIEKQVKFLLEHSSKDLVFCNYFMVFEDSFKVNAVRLSPIEKKIESWLLTTGYGGLLESTGLARRTSLLGMGGFDQDLQMCGGLDLAFRFRSSKSAGSVDEYLCGYRVTAGGWHNNKSDLITSYDLLLKKRDLYGRYEYKARIFLKFHLSLWQIRNDAKSKQFWLLFVLVMRNPFLFAYYVFATGSRVFLASLRGFLLQKSATRMREALLLC